MIRFLAIKDVGALPPADRRPSRSAQAARHKALAANGILTMSKLHQLHDLLLSVRDERRSGRVYVSQKKQGRTSTMVFIAKDGEILDVTPLSAFEDERFHETEIKRVALIPSAAGQRRNRDAPDMSAVLRKLRSDLGIGDQAADFQTVELKEEVCQVMADLVGSDALRQVDAIAARLPPDKKPGEFLDECKSLVEIMLNPGVAERIFKPMYDSVRGLR